MLGYNEFLLCDIAIGTGSRWSWLRQKHTDYWNFCLYFEYVTLTFQILKEINIEIHILKL
jgi:hypothetical protein